MDAVSISCLGGVNLENSYMIVFVFVFPVYKDIFPCNNSLPDILFQTKRL